MNPKQSNNQGKQDLDYSFSFNSSLVDDDLSSVEKDKSVQQINMNVIKLVELISTLKCVDSFRMKSFALIKIHSNLNLESNVRQNLVNKSQQSILSSDISNQFEKKWLKIRHTFRLKQIKQELQFFQRIQQLSYQFETQRRSQNEKCQNERRENSPRFQEQLKQCNYISESVIAKRQQVLSKLFNKFQAKSECSIPSFSTQNLESGINQSRSISSMIRVIKSGLLRQKQVGFQFLKSFCFEKSTRICSFFSLLCKLQIREKSHSLRMFMNILKRRSKHINDQKIACVQLSKSIENVMKLIKFNAYRNIQLNSSTIFLKQEQKRNLYLAIILEKIYLKKIRQGIIQIKFVSNLIKQGYNQLAVIVKNILKQQIKMAFTKINEKFKGDQIREVYQSKMISQYLFKKECIRKAEVFKCISSQYNQVKRIKQNYKPFTLSLVQHVRRSVKANLKFAFALLKQRSQKLKQSIVIMDMMKLTKIKLELQLKQFSMNCIKRITNREKSVEILERILKMKQQQFGFKNIKVITNRMMAFEQIQRIVRMKQLRKGLFAIKKYREILIQKDINTIKLFDILTKFKQRKLIEYKQELFLKIIAKSDYILDRNFRFWLMLNKSIPNQILSRLSDAFQRIVSISKHSIKNTRKISSIDSDEIVESQVTRKQTALFGSELDKSYIDDDENDRFFQSSMHISNKLQQKHLNHNLTSLTSERNIYENSRKDQTFKEVLLNDKENTFQNCGYERRRDEFKMKNAGKIVSNRRMTTPNKQRQPAMKISEIFGQQQDQPFLAELDQNNQSNWKQQSSRQINKGDMPTKEDNKRNYSMCIADKSNFKQFFFEDSDISFHSTISIFDNSNIKPNQNINPSPIQERTYRQNNGKYVQASVPQQDYSNIGNGISESQYKSSKNQLENSQLFSYRNIQPMNYLMAELIEDPPDYYPSNRNSFY